MIASYDQSAMQLGRIARSLVELAKDCRRAESVIITERY